MSPPTLAQLDHFMFAVPCLEQGMEWARDVFDNAPAYGGEHVGLGTRNALLSLGSCYLEIIAPDPAQPLSGTAGERFATLREGGLVTWAAAGQLSGIAAALSANGIASRGPARTRRNTQSGELLEWDLLFPRPGTMGGRLPFFIDWLDCPHPADTQPQGGQLTDFSLTLPDPTPLKAVLQALGLTYPVSHGEPDMVAQIHTRRGSVVLRSHAETRNIRWL